MSALYLGVGVMVWRQGKILLGRRLSSDNRETCWQFPGGHIEEDETILDVARREVREETGLILTNCQTAGYGNKRASIATKDYFTLYVTACSNQGKPYSKEPNKSKDWQWFAPNQLPHPLFLPIQLYLEQYPNLNVFDLGG